MTTPSDETNTSPEADGGGHNGTHAARDADVDRGGQQVGLSKFDLGPRQLDLPSENIPWGYGEDRISAMARDPDWLYVYWELTDEAIAKARAAMGRLGVDAWCCLRVYDTTGQVFDGTNAVSALDIAVERASREWFLHLGKPGTSAHVDVGLKSRDGSFHTIARSGRTDFPRKRPSADITVQWLSVTEAQQEPAPPTSQPYLSRFQGPEPLLPGVPATGAASTPPPSTRPPVATRTLESREVAVFWKTTWTERRVVPWSVTVSHRQETSYQRLAMPWFSATWRSEWQGESKSFDWFTPLHAFSSAGSMSGYQWIEGPFPLETREDGRVVVRFVGQPRVLAQWQGEEAIVYGPWEVTIHGFTPEPSRRVLGSWVMHWVRPVVQRWERWQTPLVRTFYEQIERDGLLLGASESQHWAERGASELWMLGASETLWLGLNESWSIGASELSFLGASEWTVSGASELTASWAYVQLGGSELVWSGASEQFVHGASEQWMQASAQWSALGASESLQLGESELTVSGMGLLAGGSEMVGASEWLGASEEWILGASEQWARELIPGASEQLYGPIPELGGASEALPIPFPSLGGASEQRHLPTGAVGGASEFVPAGASEHLGPDDESKPAGNGEKGGA